MKNPVKFLFVWLIACGITAIWISVTDFNTVKKDDQNFLPTVRFNRSGPISNSGRKIWADTLTPTDNKNWLVDVSKSKFDTIQIVQAEVIKDTDNPGEVPALLVRGWTQSAVRFAFFKLNGNMLYPLDSIGTFRVSILITGK